MTAVAERKPLAVEKPEKSVLMKQWEDSNDDRNDLLNNKAENRKLGLGGEWRFIGHAEVSDGYRTVFLTSGIKAADAPRHIAAVVRRRAAGDNEEGNQ